MRLLLRREQRSGMLGKQTFSLDVRAQLSDEERSNIAKYKLGETVLFQRYSDEDRHGETKSEAFARWLHDVTIYARDLEGGRRFDCSSITEMLGVEAAIKDAALNFKAVLDAATTFGGEEVLEF
jgi:hypothetical protein